MKKITLFLYIILLFSSCNKFTSFGTYEFGDGKVQYGKLTLNKDKSYEYYSFSCIGYCNHSKGFGTYEISKDSLILNHHGTPDSIVTRISTESIDGIEKTASIGDQYIYIQLEVYDKTISETIMYAGISSSKLNEKDNYTDENGKIKLNVLKTDLPLDLQVSFLGYHPVHLNIDDPLSDYHIKINMKSMDTSNDPNWLSQKEVRKIEFSRDTLWMNGRRLNSPWIKK